VEAALEPIGGPGRDPQLKRTLVFYGRLSGMKDASSFTAQTMALQRAFESHRRAATRLFLDPYADEFLHGSLKVVSGVSRLPIVGPAVPRLYDAIAGPGPRPSAIARTRLIDDVIDAAAAGVGQVVILGAGFDSRAYRLGSLGRCTVFEVDHPATQATKRAIVDRMELDARVVYVAVDFERDELDARLEASGFDRRVPSLFLWEGVTNYLTADAVDQTLATIRALAASGGTLVFTYVHAGALDGSVHFPEARRWLKGVELSGEPWTFGLRPEAVGAFLEQRGYEIESDVSTAEAGARWFPELGRRERGSALYHVAVARIPGRVR
jgi:methyltransferase (TIGR00027 family)